MMAFFEGLMKQVMERQEAMQQRFLETIEKREQDRMIREEAWKRQEMARLNREHEMMAQERSISASRDAAIIAFLQKVTGQMVPVPSTLPAASVTPPPPAVKQPQPLPAAASAPPPPPQPQPQPPQHPPPQHPPAQQQTKQHIQHQGTEIVCAQASPVEVGPVADAPEAVGAASGTGGAVDPASSRWPKAEVHALIKIRSGLECRYQEAGPKGPLWEEIAGQMQRMGYNRSSKRCKEKWENINKYFKKVKESNKRRPEDSKTCPYFHQLDALYRNKKAFGGAGAAGSMIQTRDQQLLDQLDANSPTSQDQPAHAGLLLLQAPPQHAANTETEGKDGGGNGANRKGGNREGNGGSSSLQMQTSNGGFATSFFDEEPGSAAAKKPEGIVKGLMDQQQQHQKQQRHAVMEAYKSTLEEADSDNMDVEEDDEDDDEDDEDSKTAYKIHYQQRPGVNGGSNGGGNQTTSAATVAAAAAAGSSFMAMVQ